MPSKKIYSHIPHPFIESRKKANPNPKPEPEQEAAEEKPLNAVERFNAFLALKITAAVGTMWCAYAFAALALVSLPEAIKGGSATLVAWIAQTFLQLVLLSIIIVGQKIAGKANDKRAIATYNDAEAVLHEAVEIQKHLEAQDTFLQQLVEEVVNSRASNPPGGKPDHTSASGNHSKSPPESSA